MLRFALLFASVAFCTACFAAAEEGLILHYTFDEGAGQVVRDKSGHGHDGKIQGQAEWVKEEAFTALSFNGTNTHLQCGKKPSLALSNTGTLEVWCMPEEIQGGLVSWHLGQRWTDQRLVLAFNSWHDSRAIAVVSDGTGAQQLREPLVKGQWAHLVLTLDGSNVTLYVNGDLSSQVPQSLLPAVKDVPLRMGICEGLGQAWFRGMMGEVRIYNRALSRQEIGRHFSAGVKALGLKLPLTVRLSARLYARRGELAVEGDLTKLGRLAPGSAVKAALLDSHKKTVQEAVKAIPKDAETVKVTFKTDRLAAGLYDISAVVVDKTGKQIGDRSTVKWYFPRIAQRLGASPGKKILNNLVTQLMRVDALPAETYQELSFDNPRKGWVFVSSTAQVDYNGAIRVSIDGEKDAAVLQLRYGDGKTMEAMRFLPAGEHKLRIWAEPTRSGALPAISSATVRAVPAMMYCTFPARAHSGYGAYDFKFLEKDVLPNINTIVGSGEARWHPEQREWKRRGGQWFLEQNIPTLLRAHLKDVPDPLTGEYAFNYWARSTGFTNPYLDGVMADEFSGGNSADFRGYMDAIKRIAKDEKFKDKSVHTWCGAMYVPSLARDFARTVIDRGYKIAWEVYLPEKPTADAARDFLDSRIGREMTRWHTAFPGFPKDLIFVLAILCAPPESVNLNPQVDYKVFLDMQYNYLANVPECFGLYGVMVYKSTYAEEEAVRWAGRLFRHYCIEGNTDLLSARYGYKYRLDHIQNGDFDDGLDKWAVSATEEGSVKTKTVSGLGTLFGRYGSAAHGNSFLWMKRHADRPNKVSQEINNLKPGRLYSMKMIAADWQDVSQGKAQKKRLAVSVNIEGVDIIPSRSFISDIRGIYRIGFFQDKSSGPAYNHHRRVFRAKGEKANLTISDWADEKKRGGPVGQEILLNFIEIQPYFSE